MKITNTVLTANQRSNNIARVNPKFKGKLINKKNLEVIGDSAIYGSAISQITNMFSGHNPEWSLLSLLMLGCGVCSNFASKFVKKVERLKLNPNIVFEQAENIEQAANFAKINFKINDFNVDDLSTANWINKGLTQLSNKFKGHTHMAKK